MELLERGDFLKELTGALKEVFAGRGRTVLVSGEAGIGKTALVERFVEGHRGVANIFWGACDALFTPRPLGPLHDIARETHGELLALLEQQSPRNAIFSSFLDEIDKPDSTSIVVVEDAHWADEATLDLLKFVGRRIHRCTALLIITYRDDEVGGDHPLWFVLGDLPHREVTRLHLPPLSEAAVSELAGRMGQTGHGLHAATGGNPFFVTEILASKGQSVPATVRDACFRAHPVFRPPPARCWSWFQ